MSEPRLHIKNSATGNMLYVNGWKADTIDDQNAGERDVKFKVNGV